MSGNLPYSKLPDTPPLMLLADWRARISRDAPVETLDWGGLSWQQVVALYYQEATSPVGQYALRLLAQHPEQIGLPVPASAPWNAAIRARIPLAQWLADRQVCPRLAPEEATPALVLAFGNPDPAWVDYCLARTDYGDRPDVYWIAYRHALQNPEPLAILPALTALLTFHKAQGAARGIADVWDESCFQAQTRCVTEVAHTLHHSNQNPVVRALLAAVSHQPLWLYPFCAERSTLKVSGSKSRWATQWQQLVQALPVTDTFWQRPALGFELMWAAMVATKVSVLSVDMTDPRNPVAKQLARWLPADPAMAQSLITRWAARWQLWASLDDQRPAFLQAAIAEYSRSTRGTPAHALAIPEKLYASIGPVLADEPVLAATPPLEPFSL